MKNEKRTDEQYIDVMLCFSRYFLISQKQAHSNKDIYKFLRQNKSSDLINIAHALKKGCVAYEVWQIFDFLDAADIERVRQKTLMRLT